ncbi:preprotein translocase subunit SecY [Providencia stuartii]|nr:preprotein translocase subunit SecY [Providencia stuartii]
MWLGEQITERGIGNGISIIIFAGIVAGLPPAIGHTIEQARQGDLHFLLLLLVAVLVFAVTFFVVFMERGQRRIVVNYAKRQQGRRVYAAQSTHLPLKVNMAGVIPAIFASSIILFPGTIASWFGDGTGWGLADNSFYVLAAWSTVLCVALCFCDHLLLFLLYGVGFQPKRNSR